MVFIDEQGIDPVLEWDEHDPVATFTLAFQADKCVGVARLLPDGRIGRMAVLKVYRGGGIGSRLLAELLSVARDRNLLRVHLSAQVSAVPFYLRHGFIKSGKTYTLADIPHQDMYLEL